jgi:hypothetical protein
VVYHAVPTVSIPPPLASTTTPSTEANIASHTT